MAWDHAGLYGPNNFEYPDGLLAVGASFAVRQGSQLVDVWADSDRTVMLANPGVVDALGNLTFYAEPGYYQLTVDGTGAPQTFTILVSPDPADLAAVDPEEDGPEELLPLVFSRQSPWSGWTQFDVPVSTQNFGGIRFSAIYAVAPALASLAPVNGNLFDSTHLDDLYLSLSALTVGFSGPTGREGWSLHITPTWGDGQTQVEGDSVALMVDELVFSGYPAPAEVEALLYNRGAPLEKVDGYPFLSGLTLRVYDPDTGQPVVHDEGDPAVNFLALMLDRLSIYEGSTLTTPILNLERGIIGLDLPHLQHSVLGSFNDGVTRSDSADATQWTRYNSEDSVLVVPPNGSLRLAFGYDSDEDAPTSYLGLDRPLRLQTDAVNGEDAVRLSYLNYRLQNIAPRSIPWTESLLEVMSGDLVEGDDGYADLTIDGESMVVRLTLNDGVPKVRLNFTGPGEGKYESLIVQVVNSLDSDADQAEVIYTPNTSDQALDLPGLVAGGVAVYRFDVGGGGEGTEAYGAAVYTPEGDAGRQLYSGGYEGEDSTPGVWETAVSGTFHTPLVNAADNALDPGWINFTATTHQVRVVLQGIVWTNHLTPDPADNILDYGGALQWQFHGIEDGVDVYPTGNPRTIVQNDDSRAFRQMEITIPTVPGNSYRWEWLHLVAGGGSGYIAYSSRALLQCSIYSA